MGLNGHKHATLDLPQHAAVHCWGCSTSIGRRKTRHEDVQRICVAPCVRHWSQKAGLVDVPSIVHSQQRRPDRFLVILNEQ